MVSEPVERTRSTQSGPTIGHVGEVSEHCSEIPGLVGVEGPGDWVIVEGFGVVGVEGQFDGGVFVAEFDGDFGASDGVSGGASSVLVFVAVGFESDVHAVPLSCWRWVMAASMRRAPSLAE
jgi:hypothetical protein